MKTLRSIVVVILSITVLGPNAWAGCNKNQSPDNKSCCDKDTDSTQMVCFTDQEGQSAANVYCHADCDYQSSTCTFTKPATHGCTSSGSYNDVWKRTNTGTHCECIAGEKKVDYYQYTTGPSPVHQGETVKYIIDEDNCGG
jgi:hypothetical protein